ncbi:MAG TPA: universal stress protein [Vicinamibacterales bacterium]|nr:universal stress protein [Vicinamibacterales bacterium]
MGKYFALGTLSTGGSGSISLRNDGIKVALHHAGATMRGAVIAAIDLGPSSARVLLHAAGLARLLSAPLTVLHVCADRSNEERERVIDFCKRAGPYEIDIDQTEVVVRSGHVSEIIRREAKDDARLVVIGSRGHGGLAKLLLGSSSEAVLRNTVAPVLLVPPIDLDIVSIADQAQLNSGPILAAVDLAEACDHQLSIASRMADLAKQPLLLMTVAPVRLSDHQAARMLRERGHHLSPVRPRATIVRRGKVAEEISRCASAEGAGLVVMGLRTRPRGQPGTIASAVLKTNRAFVLAVPGC